MSLTSKLKRNVRNTILGLGLVSILASCNDSNGNPPVCDSNSAVVLAEDYGLPQSIVDAIAPLGDDCVVDSNESKLLTELLPGVLQRSNEEVALSYPERFVGDDGKFDEAENITMSRFLLGRYDREGLLVHPGYFQLVDDGHVQIPNAYFMSIFEMPFRFDPFPQYHSGGKALPIIDGNPLISMYTIFNLGRALENLPKLGKGYSWFEAFRDNIAPSPNECATDLNYASTQFVFRNESADFPSLIELVNPLPVPLKVVEIREFSNFNPPIRNAALILEPVYWPSSLGHPNLNVNISHVDDEHLDINVNDIIPVEGKIGYVETQFPEWMLIYGLSSDNGLSNGESSPIIDILHPFPYDPDRRGRAWPTYIESVDSRGVPTDELFGVHNSVCNFKIGDQIYWGNHSIINPMKFNYPDDTVIK